MFLCKQFAVQQLRRKDVPQTTMEYETIRALHRLNVAVKRMYDSSPVKEELEHAAGTNGWILGYLADHEGMEIYQRDLERDLCISRSGISKLVAMLEKNGLIERERVASDDRLKKLLLSQRAGQYIEQIRADNRRMESQLTRGFSEEELHLLHSFFERMQQNISEES